MAIAVAVFAALPALAATKPTPTPTPTNSTSVTASPPGAPTAAQCRAIAPARTAPASGTANRHGTLRVIGIQYLQRFSNVTDAASFTLAMRCLFQTYVVPLEVPGRPTLVVLNEDLGLMPGLEGPQGEPARLLEQTDVDGHRAGAPLGDGAPAPVGAVAAIGQLNASYAPQVAAYQAMFGPIDPRKEVFVAATDTFVRGFVIPMSQLAQSYHVYVVACANMAPYRETHNRAEVAIFGDPADATTTGPTAADPTAYVATSQQVYNTTFLWGPKDVHPSNPDGERNLLFKNEKVPLTSLESSLLDLDEGPAGGPAAIANARGYVLDGFHLGFATSLPAFTYGYPFGGKPPAHPCADVALTYMSCMNSLGVNTVIQAEANPGRWAADAGDGVWQPLEWMSSAWRAVTDPTVHFRYAINPMLVGNLFDLSFDGQSSIVERGSANSHRAFYVGDATAQAGDPEADWVYAGAKPQFLALAPWVMGNAPRATLEAEAARLSAGSGSAQENDYVETAVYADLLPS